MYYTCMSHATMFFVLRPAFIGNPFDFPFATTRYLTFAELLTQITTTVCLTPSLFKGGLLSLSGKRFN